MRYMLLIYGNEQSQPGPGTPEGDRQMAGYFAFHGDVVQRGVFRAGEPLQPIATATTVRVRDGKRLVTDGPFAETKEQLGGFYILECADLDEALDYAARIPTVHGGSIEVRPTMDIAGAPSVEAPVAQSATRA